MKQDLKKTDFFCLEKKLWLANQTTNIRAYDFQFTPLFSVSRPRINEPSKIVARIGAIADYSSLYLTYQDLGFDASVAPFLLWQNILELENNHSTYEIYK